MADEPQPIRQHVEPPDPRECPECEGNPAMMADGECTRCHNTGRIWIYDGTTRLREPLKLCFCTQTNHLVPMMGIVRDCPLCHESGGVLPELNWHLYEYIINHLPEIAAFQPLRSGTHDITSVRGVTIYDALAGSSQHRAVNESVSDARYYILPALTSAGVPVKLPDRYDVFIQDSGRPLGVEGQHMILKHGKLDDCVRYLAQHPRTPPRDDAWRGW